MIDTVGNTYGCWTVLARAKERSGNSRFVCRCRCGTVSVVSRSSLRHAEQGGAGCRQCRYDATNEAALKTRPNRIVVNGVVKQLCACGARIEHNTPRCRKCSEVRRRERRLEQRRCESIKQQVAITMLADEAGVTRQAAADYVGRYGWDAALAYYGCGKLKTG